MRWANEVEPRGAAAPAVEDQGREEPWVSRSKSPRPESWSWGLQERVGATKAANWDCRDSSRRWAMRSFACAAMPSPWTASLRATSSLARRTYKAASLAVTPGRTTTFGLCRHIPSTTYLDILCVTTCHAWSGEILISSACTLRLWTVFFFLEFLHGPSFLSGCRYSSSQS